MNSSFSIFRKTIAAVLPALLLSAKLMAQGVAVINVSGAEKVMSGENAQFELSFVIKDFELNTDAVDHLRERLNQTPAKFSVTVAKDDIKPEAVFICEFKAENYEQLNLFFHEVLGIIHPVKVIFNETEYTDYNSVLIE